MISFEIDEAIARITLNRPSALNALNAEGIAELAAIADRLSCNDRVRAVLITGQGERAFCAGGDVTTFVEHAGHEAALLKQMTDPLNHAVARLMRLNAPIVAAVNGVAAGVGLSLVALADLAIAANTARFHTAYTQIGYTPDGGSSWLLPRLIGQRRAMELYLTGRSLNADEALAWGLINQVTPADQLAASAEALVRRLAQGPTGSFGMVKKLLLASSSNELNEHLVHEAHAIIGQSQTEDGREGVRAFVEKRAAHFRGI
jgi:2-(1,2-epoxy-1,2-dihydrophenyl)acetyl-CoA isomerase